MFDESHIYDEYMSIQTSFVTESYTNVMKRLLVALQPFSIDKDTVKSVLLKHKNNINKIPIYMQNIDRYFAKKNGDIVSLYNELCKELDKVPNDKLTKKLLKRQVFDNLKLAESNEYVLFKVSTHDDAVTLTRPGKNNQYNWPHILPISWCIAADSRESAEIFNDYVNQKPLNKANLLHDVTSRTISMSSKFFFAFRKHPLLNQNIQGYTVNPYDFICIQVFDDTHIECTLSPNDNIPGFHLYTWCDKLPLSWKQLCLSNTPAIDINALFNSAKLSQKILLVCKFPELITKLTPIQLKNMDAKDWYNLLSKHPQYVDLAKKYDGLFKLLDTVYQKWLLQQHPNFANYI